MHTDDAGDPLETRCIDGICQRMLSLDHFSENVLLSMRWNHWDAESRNKPTKKTLWACKACVASIVRSEEMAKQRRCLQCQTPLSARPGGNASKSQCRRSGGGRCYACTSKGAATSPSGGASGNQASGGVFFWAAGVTGPQQRALHLLEGALRLNVFPKGAR